MAVVQETVEHGPRVGDDDAGPAIDVHVGAEGKQRIDSVDHSGWHVSHR
jgi:hypothetical protein